MTTNKPEVVAWYFPSSKTTLPVVSLNARNGNGQSLIRLSDYEALQVERDHYKNVIKEVTTRNLVERWSKTAADKELEQYLSSGISQLENEHRKQIEALRAECEKLRRDAERYQWLRDVDVIEGDVFSSINEWLWADGDFQEVSSDIDAAMQGESQ